jgi:hypothetical protein
MNPLTKQAVRDAAEQLITQNGQTTTLEVKTALRNLGYFARQSEVSVLMDELCQELSWEFMQNGAFRIYRKRRDLDGDILKILFSDN